MTHHRLRAAASALALAALLAGCTGAGPTAPAPTPTTPITDPTPSATPTEPPPAPTEITVAPPAPEPPAWAGPRAVDTADWQTFTMPGGEASFRLPPSWEVRDVHAFSPGTPEPAGWAHVYTDDGEHLLGLHLVDEPWSFRCDGPGLDSRVLHAEPVELALSTPHGGTLSTEVRFDAIGVVGSVTVSLTDGWTDAAGCSPDTQVDVTPAANGIAAIAFGTGGPGPGLQSAPSFSGFSSASRALELVDTDRLATAWAIVRSLEVAP